MEKGGTRSRNEDFVRLSSDYERARILVRTLATLKVVNIDPAAVENNIAMSEVKDYTRLYRGTPARTLRLGALDHRRMWVAADLDNHGAVGHAMPLEMRTCLADS